MVHVQYILRFDPVLTLFHVTLSSLQVSHSWNDLVSSRVECITRIVEYRRKSTQNADNCGVVPLIPFRPPAERVLRNVKNICTQPQIFSKKNDTLFSHVKPQCVQSFRPCPNCQSPAKELNLRRTECTNTNCRFDFCKLCLMPWHERECPKREMNSPKKRSSDKLAGTSRSKKRLRRL